MFTWNSTTSDSTSTLHSIRSLSPSTSSLGRSLLSNLARSKLYHSLSSLDKTKMWSRFYVDDEENVQKVLDAVSLDQKVITNPLLNRKRRTVIVSRNDRQQFGFAIQSYVLKKDGDEIPLKISYIDYVQLDSPAAEAGIRPGDVIISINGRVVTTMSHMDLIQLIGSCRQMRMVLIFENIRQRIELVARAIRLRKLLNDKLYQLNLIDIEEQKILNRAYARSQAALTMNNSLCDSLSSRGTSSLSSFKSHSSSRHTLTSNPDIFVDDDVNVDVDVDDGDGDGDGDVNVEQSRAQKTIDCGMMISELELPKDAQCATKIVVEDLSEMKSYSQHVELMDEINSNDCCGDQQADSLGEDLGSVMCSISSTATDNQTAHNIAVGNDEDANDKDANDSGDKISSSSRSSNGSSSSSSSSSSNSLHHSSSCTMIDSVALQHIFRLENGDNNSIHITKL